MNVLGVVLARGGSTRIANKNMLPLGGMSLVARAASDAALSSVISRLVISTDSEELAKECSNVCFIRRPAELSGPTAKIEDAVKHALIECEKCVKTKYDYVVALQAAVPVRPAGAIDLMVEAVVKHKARGAVSVVPATPWIWQVNKFDGAFTWWNAPDYPRSQDCEHTNYAEVNSIQVTPREEVLAGKRWSVPLVLFVLPRWADLDIDTPDDYAHAVTSWPTIERRMKNDKIQFDSRLVGLEGNV